jgi:hypothetical protein
VEECEESAKICCGLWKKVQKTLWVVEECEESAKVCCGLWKKLQFFLWVVEECEGSEKICCVNVQKSVVGCGRMSKNL